MKSVLPFRLLGLAAAAILASCGPQLETTRLPVSAPASAKSSSSLTNRLDRSLNDYRHSIGKRTLPRHEALDRMAYDHCVFMARNRGKFQLGSPNISHYGFDARALAAQRLYGMGSVAENVAGGTIRGDIPSQLVHAWAESKRHNYNLRQNWDVTGLGVYVADDGMVYATQIFANQSHSQMAMVDRFREF